MCRVGIAVLAIVLLASTGSAYSQQLTGRASITDGDTIEIHGKRIRLHGIDAPESSQLCHTGGKPWRCGQKAALALDERIGGGTVSCTEEDIDRYGRVVGICFRDGVDLNEWMVRQGWAMAYRRYSTAYVAAEDDARRNRRGIWGSEFIPPWEWRARKRNGTAREPQHTVSANPSAGPPTKGSCCKVCRTGKACGNSCIPQDRVCRKGPGCAC